MSNIYDDIANAVVTMLAANCGSAFKSYNRGVLLYDDVIQRLQSSGAPLEFPQLWFYEGVGLGGGTIEYERPARGTPVKRTVTYTIVMYALKDKANTPSGADNTQVGSTILNPLQALVEAAFIAAIDLENTVTLGRIVSHCWIEGTSYSIPGDIDPSGLAMLTVPVKVLIP